MNLQIKGTRYEPTPEVRAQADTQVGGLSRFIDESMSEAQALLELERAVGGQREGDIWRAELTITHEGKVFRAESTKAKLANALTTVSRDVRNELSRAHKRDDRRRKSGGKLLKALFRGFGQ
jgi:ribosome-associated translation inhibitor RaiA